MPEPTLLPQLFPNPDPGGGLDRERESELMRQHAHLSAMMGLMRNHVRKHGGPWRPRPSPTVTAKVLHATFGAGEGVREHLVAACSALGQRRTGLFLRATRAVQPGRQLQMRSRKPQPLAANVVDVSKYCSNGASLAAGRFGSPRAGIEMLQQDLIYPVVDSKSLQQRLTKVGRWHYSGAGHRTSLQEGRLTRSRTQSNGARCWHAPGLPGALHPRIYFRCRLEFQLVQGRRTRPDSAAAGEGCPARFKSPVRPIPKGKKETTSTLAALNSELSTLDRQLLTIASLLSAGEQTCHGNQQYGANRCRRQAEQATATEKTEPGEEPAPSRAPTKPRATSARQPKPAPRVTLPASHPAISPMIIQPSSDCCITVILIFSSENASASKDGTAAQAREVSHIFLPVVCQASLRIKKTGDVRSSR